MLSSTAPATIPIVIGVGEEPVQLRLVEEYRMRRASHKATIAILFVTVLAGVAPDCALAQAGYPEVSCRSRPAAQHVLARIVGDKLQAKWGQPFIVENKTRACGNIGAKAAYQASTALTLCQN